jgi:hypothetical protein
VKNYETQVKNFKRNKKTPALNIIKSKAVQHITKITEEEQYSDVAHGFK